MVTPQEAYDKMRKSYGNTWLQEIAQGSKVNVLVRWAQDAQDEDNLALRKRLIVGMPTEWGSSPKDEGFVQAKIWTFPALPAEYGINQSIMKGGRDKPLAEGNIEDMLNIILQDGWKGKNQLQYLILPA